MVGIRMEQLQPPAQIESLQTTSFGIYPSTVKKLDALAAAEGISRSELIRWILATYVDLYQK